VSRSLKWAITLAMNSGIRKMGMTVSFAAMLAVNYALKSRTHLILPNAPEKRKSAASGSCSAPRVHKRNRPAWGNEQLTRDCIGQRVAAYKEN